MTNKWIFDKNAGESYLVKNEEYDIIKTGKGIYLQIDIDNNDDDHGIALNPENSFTYKDIKVTPSAEKFSNSDYINIRHVVSNNGSQAHTINLLVFSELTINGTEICNQHNIGGHKGVEFQANPDVRFLLRNSPKVTNVDTYAFHKCYGGNRTNCSDWSDKNASAKIYFSWQNIVLQSNGRITLSYNIGAGDEYPKRKAICDTQIESRYDTSSNITLSISVESMNNGDPFSISRQIFDSSNNSYSDKEGISNQNDFGSKFTHNDTFILPNKPGNYIIRYIVKDQYGEETTDVPIFVKLIPTIELISKLNYSQKPNSSFAFKVNITDDISFNFSVIDDKNTTVFHISQSINSKETKEIAVEFNLTGYSEGPHQFRLFVTDDMGYTNETTISVLLKGLQTQNINIFKTKFLRR